MLEATADGAPADDADGDSATGVTFDVMAPTLEAVVVADALAGRLALATAGGGSLQAAMHAEATAASKNERICGIDGSSDRTGGVVRAKPDGGPLLPDVTFGIHR